MCPYNDSMARRRCCCSNERTLTDDDDAELEGLRGRLVKRKEHASEEEGVFLVASSHILFSISAKH